ncbi:MAG: ABC transporter ATP-binding protein [Oscillospiraceae bacterium]
MRQRVMIAMALLCRPEVLIAYEPTTALDVTIQAQILDLLDKLNKEMGTAIILITHDLGVIAQTADNVAVMYAGHIVETAPVRTLFFTPLHPYTRGLLKSVPKMEDSGEKLQTIEGNVPSIYKLPTGCAFNNRCQMAKGICSKSEPPVVKKGETTVKCWMYTDSWR